MPLIRLLGGLGNQLFQVAAGLEVERRYGWSPTYDTSWYASDRMGDTFRQLEVATVLRDEHTVSLPRALTRALYSRKNPLLRIEGSPGDDLLGEGLKRSTVLHGYFQTAAYPTAVAPKLEAMLKPHLRDSSSRSGIAVHVRLGDYYDNPAVRSHHGLLEPEYFARAIEQARDHGAEGDVVVFTDSPSVFEREYQPHLREQVTLDETETAWETLREMSTFSTLVIANSSLSWWAAFIASHLRGGQPRVLAPHPWMGAPSAMDRQLPDPAWHVLARSGS